MSAANRGGVVNHTATDVGIVAAACELPPERRSLESVFSEEGADLTPELASELGIEEVPVCTGQTGSELSLASAQRAIELAELKASKIDVIIDYTVMPQEYLVPSWNMSNKIQHELGAKKAITLGFSGTGPSSLHVAISFATALIQADEKINTALLIAADTAIPSNRVLNPGTPMTILGDGASAVVLQRGAEKWKILDTALHSDGGMHDVCYIPGGSLMHPDDPDLYRLQLNHERFTETTKMEKLKELAGTVLDRNGFSLDDVAYFLYSNISAADQAEFAHTFDVSSDKVSAGVLAGHGHVHGTDLVLNFMAASDGAATHEGDLILMGSHGMGFLSGVSLIRH